MQEKSVILDKRQGPASPTDENLWCEVIAKVLKELDLGDFGRARKLAERGIASADKLASTILSDVDILRVLGFTDFECSRILFWALSRKDQAA